MSNPVPRLRRLLAIIPLIQRRGGISLQELQDTLAVSRRELEKDLHAIMLCGVPPYLPNDYISVFIDGDWVTVDYAEHFARPTRLTLREALALRLAIERLPLPDEGPLSEAAIDLLDALDRIMRKAGAGSMAALEGRIAATPTGEVGGRLALLDEAIAARRPLELSYFSPSSDRAPRRRRVRPYARGDRHGKAYLLAHCEERQHPISLRIDRIGDVAPAPDAPPFELPADFDAEAMLDRLVPGPGATILARLRFDAAVAAIAVDDHAGHAVERLPGGDVVISLPCGSVQWLVRHALVYGEHVEVLAPPEARAEMRRYLEGFLAAQA